MNEQEAGKIIHPCGYDVGIGCSIPNREGLQSKNCLTCNTGTARNKAAIAEAEGEKP